MTEAAFIIAVVGFATFTAGFLSGRPWITAVILAAVSLPLWFLNSPLGPIGPALMILCWTGVLIGAGTVEILRQRRA